MDLASESHQEDFVNQTCCALSEALELKKTNETEIFQILMHVSPYLGQLLPLNQDVSSSLSEISFNERNISKTALQKPNNLTYIKHICEALMFHYVQQIQKILKCDVAADCKSYLQQSHGHISPHRVTAICAHLERLEILIGERQTAEKFCSIVSKHFDFLLQHGLSFERNAFSNLQKLSFEFSAFSIVVVRFVKYVIQILSSSKLFKHKYKQLEFIKETILEKLSVELLTTSDSISDNFSKLSARTKQEKVNNSGNKQTTKFSTAVSGDDAVLSMEMLSDFANILKAFIFIECEIQTSEVLYIVDYGNSGSNKKGVLKHNSLELPDLIRTSQHSSRIHSISPIGQWDWCETFRELIPVLSTSMLSGFIVTQNSIQEAKEKYKSFDGNWLDVACSVSGKMDMCAKGQCKTVIKCIGNVLEFVSKCLPLGIVSGRHRFTSKLQTDFVDATNQTLKDAERFLIMLIEDVPEKIMPMQLPVILSTATDVVLVLQYCCLKVQCDNHLLFHGTMQMYKSLGDRAYQHILQYQKTKSLTIMLHDPESNYWSDPRAFSEDERCSYSIDMWKDHMLNLLTELQNNLCSDIVQKLLGEIFCETLSVLANRYCNCSPSYNRHNQFRRDVSEILRFSFKFIWKIIREPHQICPKRELAYLDPSHETVSKIHTACSDLFTCNNILAASLEDIHSAVSSLDNLDMGQVQGFEWMSAMEPSLFPIGWDGKFSSLNNVASVMCILRKMVDHSGSVARWTVEVLSMDKCFFSRLLINKKGILKEENSLSAQKLLLNAFLHNSAYFSLLFLTCVKISSNCADASLVHVEFFDKKYDGKRLPWQEILHETIMLNIQQALVPALNFMASHTWSSAAKTLCNNLPTSILGCIPGIKEEDTNEIVFICMSIVLQGLRSFALTLQDFVVSLFIDLDDFLQHEPSHVTVLCGSYGSHILLHAAHWLLQDGNFMKALVDTDISSQMVSGLQEVAHLLLDIDNLKATFQDNPSEKTKLLIDEINAFQKCTHRLFSHTNKTDDDQEDASLYDMSYLFETDSIDENTLSCINQLSSLLVDNFETIARYFKMDSCRVFQDHKLNDRQDNNSLEPSQVFNQSWSWKPSILHCFASQPIDVITHLLHQRPDMQQNAYLSEQEKDQIHFIKCYFNMQTGA